MRVPLEALNQDTQEQMLIALASNDGKTLEELIEKHDSAPADSEELVHLLFGTHHIYAETQAAVVKVVGRRVRHAKTATDIEKAECDKCADTFGHGYRSKGVMAHSE